MCSRRIDLRSLVAIALMLVLGGCGHLATHQEKEDSFKPFASTSVGWVSLRSFIKERTALLVAGATPQTIAAHDGEVGIELRPTSPDGKVDIGSATAITSDGYYLTAAHCIRRQPVFLVFPHGESAEAVVARVVWRSPTADTRWDLAVLKISGVSVRAFDAAREEEMAAGRAVVTTGFNGEAGGKLISLVVQKPPGNLAVPPVTLLIHDAPLSHGDSGGPLTTLDGKLLGIEILVRGVYFGPRQGVALHADASWLKRIIQDDERMHSIHPTTRTSASQAATQ